MSRLVPILSTACAIGIGLTAWHRLAASDVTATVPHGTPPTNGEQDEPAEPAAAALHRARRECSVAALDAVVAQLAGRVATSPDDATGWHLLAEAHLERAQQRSHLRGITVGQPVFDELPAELTADLDDGQRAVTEARRCGDESGELFRIEAGLMSQRITGLASALLWNDKIGAALTKAAERSGDDPDLHTALGLRKLLAPEWFGHDPAAALEHFTFAAKAAADERPAVFAAMATYLQHKRQQAIAWLERAVARNPANRFAQVVLRRLRRGEDDPFGRDVTAAELTAAK